MLVHAHVGVRGTDGHGRRLDAIEDQVRQPGEQQPVLARRRLTLAPVRHHYLGAASGRDAAHLPSGRETRPAAAGQA